MFTDDDPVTRSILETVAGGRPATAILTIGAPIVATDQEMDDLDLRP